MMTAIKDDDGQPEWRWLFAKLCLQVRLSAFSSVSSTAMVLVMLSEDRCELRNLESSMSEGGWGIDDESKSKSAFYLTFSSLLPSRCSKVIPPRMQYPTT